SKKPLEKVTKALNEIGLFLVTLETLVLVYHVIETKFLQFPHLVEMTRCQNDSRPATQAEKPDVYYIIMDEMSSPSIMKSVFNYDNTPFREHLKSKGFCIPAHSFANYPRTQMSLACSLNMSYIDRVATVCGDKSSDLTLLTELIQNNRVENCFKEMGYKIF